MPINWKRKTFSTICVMLMVSMIFQNVAAEFKTYTLDDDGSTITITEGQQFNVSVPYHYSMRWKLAGFDYDSGDYDSSVLKVVDSDYYFLSEGAYYFNVTFEGKKDGNYTIVYNSYDPGNSIDGNFTLNVTVIGSEPVYILPIIIVVAIVGVVSGIILFKWMKRGEEKHEK